MHIIHILSNDSLSILENFIIWVNFFGAAFALYINRKAFKQGIPRLRRSHLLIAGLATIYCIGYLLLLFSDIQFLVWSSAFRGVSILVWPIVWAMPALSSVSVWKKLEETIAEAADDE